MSKTKNPRQVLLLNNSLFACFPSRLGHENQNQYEAHLKSKQDDVNISTSVSTSSKTTQILLVRRKGECA